MRYIFSVLLLATLILVVLVYQKTYSNTNAADLEVVMLKIIRNNAPAITLKTQLADNIAKRAHGLMEVKHLPEDSAMLFAFEDEASRKMWMENTHIPLDMLFIGADKTIHNFHKNAVPLSREIIFSVTPSKYVIEVNAGFIDKNNIQIGDKIEFDE